MKPIDKTQFAGFLVGSSIVYVSMLIIDLVVSGTIDILFGLLYWNLMLFFECFILSQWDFRRKKKNG